MESVIKEKIDQLFHSIGTYRRSAEFKELLDFCCKFHYLSPFNAMLVQMQRPGASIVQTAKNWKKIYNVQLKQTARPLIILVPFGPVDFVFDVEDTEGNKGLIPESILQPFKTNGKIPGKRLDYMLNNLKYYGIKFEYSIFGNQQQAQIERLKKVSINEIELNYKDYHYKVKLREYYLISINNNGTKEDLFAGLVHELAHFFCQHLPPVTEDWWKYRELTKIQKEFEAETIAWLVCERIGIKNPSEEYLATYLHDNAQIPAISLEMILKATNTIEGLLIPQSIGDGLLAKKDEGVKSQLVQIKKNK